MKFDPPNDPRPEFAELIEGVPDDPIDEFETADEEVEADVALRKAMRASSPRRRRRLEERRTRPTFALNMTPMIDVVFQLLVYFLVATSFVVSEELYRVDLPRRAASSADASATSPTIPQGDPFELDREPIRVLVTTTGPNPDDCTIEIVGVADSIAGFEGLRAVLFDRLADPSLGTGMFLAEHPVVLEPSPATSWQHAVEAFNAAVRAGYVNVIFQTLEG